MTDSKSRHFSIKSWAEDDRPREKLLLKGRSSLSDAELIAILLGSGSRTVSAVDLAKQILASVSNDLNHLAQLSINDLKEFKGIGEAKAISIVSALELGRRRKHMISSKKPRIENSQDSYELLKPYLLDLSHEEFWVLLLNRAHSLIKAIPISQGGVAGTVVDVKLVHRAAIENLSSSILLAHNHPSGNLKPSQQDISITKKIKEGAELLDIRVIDHIIFTNQDYFSFADEGLI